MEAIILAGGMGTRLKKVVPNLPKPMAPIKNKPFLEILIQNLKKLEFTSVIISVGYKAEKIINYFGASYEGLSIKYSFEEYPLGTGGALKKAFRLCTNSFVFVCNGDTFVEFSSYEILKLSKKNKYPIVLGIEVSDTTRYSRLILKNKSLIGFTDKGLFGKGIINAGLYYLPKSIFEGFNLKESFSLESDFLVPFISQLKIYCYLTNGIFIDIGIPEDYKKSSSLLKEYI